MEQDQVVDHQDMSARIERATLENMAGALPLPPGMEAPEPEKKYPYSEADAAGYAGFIQPVLVVWSSRWKTVEPLNEQELTMLSESAGRYIAWRFPSNGEETHPGMALLIAALAVSAPRAFAWWVEKDARAADEAEKAKADEEKQGHAVAH